MESNIDTVIGLNVNIKGNIKNVGSIQVNGSVEGELKSDEHINIGETAKVKGPIVAKTVEIAGDVVGLIEVTERLVIHPTGHIVGDIVAPILVIEQGATFIGKSSMPSKSGEIAIKPEETKKEDLTEKAEKELKETKEINLEKLDKTEKNDKESKVQTEDKNATRDPLGFFRK